MKAVRIFLLAIFTVAALAYLNFVLIPKPQTSQAHTDTYNNNSDSCGNNYFQVSASSGGCGDFFMVGNSYSTSATITNNTDHTINNIRLHWKTYWCANASEESAADPSQGINAGSCLKREKDNETDLFSLAPHASKSLDSMVRSAGEEGYNTCGLYQTDFWFDYNNGACTSTRDGKNFGFAAVGYCKLWDGKTLVSQNPWQPQWECQKTTPTPTPSVTPSITPSVTPSVTPSITPTATPTTPVTPTQGVTPTATPQPTNIIINVHQEQQQQQQIVLAATVAPAPTTSKLPSTGGEGVAAIATLLSLLPVGLKLRKLI